MDRMDTHKGGNGAREMRWGFDLTPSQAISPSTDSHSFAEHWYGEENEADLM